MPTVEHVTQLTDELVSAIARLLPQLSSSAPPVGRQELAAVLANPATYLMVARDSAGQIVGTLTLVTFRIPSGKRAWIEDVVVDGSARGQGVGEALSRAAVDIAAGIGVRTVELTSRPSREVANRLYQRLGFERRETNVYRYSVALPAGQLPAGQLPAGQLPAGQLPAGQLPAGQVSPGRQQTGVSDEPESVELPEAVEPSRLIELEGAINFRDLGGYQGQDGRSVRWRALFRSDSLHRLSESDEQRLADLGLRTVFDLRTLAEIEQRGRITKPGELAYHHHPLIDVLPPLRSDKELMGPPEMAGGYMDMVREGWQSVASVLLILTEPEAYPAVFHCAIGKDRTGIISAVVLGVLGVSDDDIVADYALSQAGMRRALAEAAAENTPAEYARLVPHYGAEPETMRLFLRQFRAEYHSFDDFAAEIGLPDTPGRLRSILLQP